MRPDRPQFNTPVHVFDGSGGRWIAHLPLEGRAFYIDDVARDVIARVTNGEALQDSESAQRALQGFRELGLLGGPARPMPRTLPLTEFRPIEATLLFTETCNLACTYCYASSVNAKTPPMTLELARAAADVVIDNAARTERAEAQFRYIGGGEPTSEWDLLVRTTEHIEARAAEVGVRHFIRLITNGTLLTEDRVAWIARHIQFVTLSFDILPELQAERPYASGRSTQEKLLQVVQRLCDTGVAFHLRTTISTRGAGRLVEMVRYVHEHTGARSIRFEPMSEIGRSRETGRTKPTQQLFVESFKAAFHLGRELGIDVTCKMFKNLLRRNSRFCDAEFAVAPTGVVSACHRYSREETAGFDLFRIGQFDGERFAFDLDAINRLRAIDVHSFEDCTTCIARWNCASGCLSARLSPGGVSSSGPLCDLTRDLLKFSIDTRLGVPDVPR